MNRSLERILTTHTGSLPRPDDLVRMMFAQEEGIPVDRARSPRASAPRWRRWSASRATAGMDVVSDGEMSKPSYATYVKDRLDGFGGASHPLTYRDLVDFPELAKRVFGDPGRSRRKTPACTGPIGVRDPAAAQADVENLRAALGPPAAEDAFMTAASPGVISLFFRNDHYPSHEAYLFAIADAMRARVRDGRARRLRAPGRLPRPRDGPAHPVRRPEPRRVPADGAAARRGAEPRARQHPARAASACTCAGATTRARTTTTCRSADILDIVFAARPAAVSFEAANPRHAHEWKVFEQMKVPAGKIIIPGVIDSTTNFIEHPELVAQRIGRYAQLVGRENVIAGTDCGFGTWVGQAAVDPDIVWAKLASLAEGARLASRVVLVELRWRRITASPRPRMQVAH